jgi:transposase
MEWTVAIGVDTHKEVHVAEGLDKFGAQLDSREAGYRSLLSWAQKLGVPAFAVEGTGSYGAGLTRFLESAGIDVFECERPHREERRRGKSDLIDAALAARRVLSGERLSLPRGGGRREELRLLLLERRGAMQARNAALNQLSAVLVTAPDHIRARLGALSGDRLARAAARLRPGSEVVNGVVRRLGRRVERLSSEVAEAEHALAGLVAEIAPSLLEECGVGPVCGAQLLVSSGDPGRMRSEASFAALAGTSPVDASSPSRRLKRQTTPPPPQPRRRPPAQPSAPRRHAPARLPPHGNARLLPTTPRRRQDDAGGTPLRQARPRPPLLPPPMRAIHAPLTT